MQVDQLIEQVQRYQPSADADLIRRAYALSGAAHRGQVRQSGEAYISHPLAVAEVLAELEMDDTTIAAALLHDVVEDTGVTLDQIRQLFGSEVAHLVDGVTKLTVEEGRLSSRSRLEEQAENLRKMFLAMARDIRVILIKLADRLHNMRTLGALPQEKQRRIAEETLEVFAPLAHRLGIFRIKWQLEDLSLRYLEPDLYRDLADRIPLKRAQREAYAQELMEHLNRALREANLNAEVSGRAKHFYSIYQKIYKHGYDLSEIYDLVAVRVLVESVKDCYAVLGLVHSLWKPLPGRFKDFIAMPKSNMYQSLHTTVIGPHGEPFEIQIRTWDMHRTAEYGIAAHWMYKEGHTDPDFDKKLSWLREVLEWQRETKDPGEFMESLKLDVFSDEVFVFTPKGKVIDLPAGASPIDFAYRIHTEIGHHCVGARVNGRIAPLDYRLQNGDIIEILTNKQSAPSADWLNVVKTSSAKNRIRAWFKRERREENLERGRELLERELRRQGTDPEKVLRDDWLEEVRKKLNASSVEDMFVSLGFGGIGAGQVAGRLRELLRKEEQEQKPFELPRQTRKSSAWGKPSGGVRVKGIDNVLVRFPRCCNPVPGDEIIGYITQGRGVSIHQLHCPNIRDHLTDPDRIIEVSWDEVDAAYYPVEVQVVGLDRPGLLSEVAQVMAETRTNIISAAARGRGNQLATIDLVLQIRDLNHLDAIRRRILKVRDVFQVERTGQRVAK